MDGWKAGKAVDVVEAALEQERSDAAVLRHRIQLLEQRLRAIANLEGVVFASDDKERPMIAKAVVDKMIQGVLPDSNPTPNENQDSKS